MTKTHVNQGPSRKTAIQGDRSLIITAPASNWNNPRRLFSLSTQITSFSCQNCPQLVQFEECISGEVHFPNRNNFSRSDAYLYDLIWPLGRNCEPCNWPKYLSLLPWWDSELVKRDAMDKFLQQNCHLKIAGKFKAWGMTQWVNIVRGFFPVMFDRCHRCEHFRSVKGQIGVESFWNGTNCFKQMGPYLFPRCSAALLNLCFIQAHSNW